MQNIGYVGGQIEKALRRTTNKKLIETSQRVTFEEDVNGALIGDMPDSFRITSIGAYHLRRWMGQFTYLDAMVFDTPILSKKVREELSQDLESLSIDARYERALIFKKYLLELWGGFQRTPNYLNLSEIFEEGDSSFGRVGDAIKRNQQDADN